MKDLGIPWDSRCSVIKNLINIDQFIQDDIEYSGKQNGTYMGRKSIIIYWYLMDNLRFNCVGSGFSATSSCRFVQDVPDSIIESHFWGMWLTYCQVFLAFSRHFWQYTIFRWFLPPLLLTFLWFVVFGVGLWCFWIGRQELRIATS